MADNLGFTLRGWDEYTQWQSEDKRTLKKINQMRAYHKTIELRE